MPLLVSPANKKKWSWVTTIMFVFKKKNNYVCVDGRRLREGYLWRGQKLSIMFIEPWKEKNKIDFSEVTNSIWHGQSSILSAANLGAWRSISKAWPLCASDKLIQNFQMRDEDEELQNLSLLRLKKLWINRNASDPTQLRSEPCSPSPGLDW